jgi:hypothetical protein
MSAAMVHIGQDGFFDQVFTFMVGSLFTAYGLMGSKRMARFLPATVKEIG